MSYVISNIVFYMVSYMVSLNCVLIEQHISIHLSNIHIKINIYLLLGVVCTTICELFQ